MLLRAAGVTVNTPNRIGTSIHFTVPTYTSVTALEARYQGHVLGSFVLCSFRFAKIFPVGTSPVGDDPQIV